MNFLFAFYCKVIIGDNVHFEPVGFYNRLLIKNGNCATFSWAFLLLWWRVMLLRSSSYLRNQQHYTPYNHWDYNLFTTAKQTVSNNICLSVISLISSQRKEILHRHYSDDTYLTACSTTCLGYQNNQRFKCIPWVVLKTNGYISISPRLCDTVETICINMQQVAYVATSIIMTINIMYVSIPGVDIWR